ncbi:type VI secretion system baseplate subunit TssE [Roseateles asaccharophilus]|uniref:Type VI secretion system protein ImpF n=1 Tax=Roseateles asaccharophilus TaxID=582607 RepID=A0ABU2A9N7_9BURK|nr:type VI secretion system baseplate subunit TssE [Roseateles asaccharophilus]MDR7333835.1 type VI secretion system protein ImpF [Roseateles asaccharophilus]
MAGLGAQDRLQPSLLDRLTDHEPDSRVEALDARMLTRKQLREAVLRDLSWLFNAVCEEPDIGNRDDPERTALWKSVPHAADSVLNFGILPLTGQTMSVHNFPLIEAQLRQAIVRFEPRLDPNTVEVRIANDMTTGIRPTSLRLTIKGQMWNQPVPLELLLSADVDVDTGQAAVRDLRA